MATAGVLHAHHPRPRISTRSRIAPRDMDSQPGVVPIITQDAGSSRGVSKFQASKHLAYKAPSKIHTMSDLGFPEGTGISPTAVSEPFPLFTKEGVKAMRAEILSDEVFKNYSHSSNLAACQLRGFCPKYAPFAYDAWKSPEILAIISKIAGIELVPSMDIEIAHTNISVKSEKEKNSEMEIYKSKDTTSLDDENAVVAWHYDCYPFVCVLMLSDATSMIGGETALCTGNGEIMKVRGPQMGNAVVLQGRHIRHKALRALGATERITMVTSFRPKKAQVPDDTVLTNVRSISDLGDLYHQFSEYRLEILEERLRGVLKSYRDNARAGKKQETKAIKAFLKEQKDFIAKTDAEIVEDELVIKGHIEVDTPGSETRTFKRGTKRARED